MSPQTESSDLDRLKAENEKLRAVFEELIKAKQQQDELELFNNVKQRVYRWLKGLGIYAAVIITVVGVTSYSQAKDTLISSFNLHIQPLLFNVFRDEHLPKAKAKIEENATLRLEGIASRLEKQYESRLQKLVVKNKLDGLDNSDGGRPTEGYVNMTYLDLQNNGKYKINTYRLNVRSEPNIDSFILGRQVEGALVEIVEEKSPWARIKVLPQQ